MVLRDVAHGNCPQTVMRDEGGDDSRRCWILTAEDSDGGLWLMMMAEVLVGSEDQ